MLHCVLIMRIFTRLTRSVWFFGYKTHKNETENVYQKDEAKGLNTAGRIGGQFLVQATAHSQSNSPGSTSSVTTAVAGRMGTVTGSLSRITVSDPKLNKGRLKITTIQ